MVYKTSDIARLANIHPNTVRFYERIGLISPAERQKNRYRVFDHRHLYQIKVLRCIFLDEWPGENIRKASIKIVETMKSWDLKAARKYTKEYIQIIDKEQEKAIEAVHILKRWSSHMAEEETRETYSKNEASKIIGTTSEALRNWERNGLIVVPRSGKNRKRTYSSKELDRLRVIYILRQANYSMSAIHRCLKRLDDGYGEEAINALHNPNEENIIWTGDHWLEVIKKTRSKAEEILKLLDEIE